MSKEDTEVIASGGFEAPYYWSDEERLVAAVYRGYLVASPIIDSTSSWILLVAGASFGVGFGQLGDLDDNLKQGIVAALYWVIAAAIFAFLQKIAAVSVAAAVASASRVNRVVNELGPEKLGPLNWELTDREIRRPLFWPWSGLVGRMARKEVDNLLALRYAVQSVQIQGAATFLEAGAILGGIVALVLKAVR